MEKMCSKCKNVSDISKFSVTKRNPDGSVKYYNSWCNSCRTKDRRDKEGCCERMKSKVDLVREEKECSHCKQLLAFSQFSPSKRGSAGLSAYCRLCHKARYHDKEKARIATQSYRERNRFHWRVLHRINQFNRRSLIKVTNDGTVTREFIDAIYNKEYCCWCGEFVEPKSRTLEHIIELSCGGKHSSENIDMACFSCNSSRFNRGVFIDGN